MGDDRTLCLISRVIIREDLFPRHSIYSQSATGAYAVIHGFSILAPLRLPDFASGRRLMRWFRVRKVRIDDELRKTFEQYGVPVMQQVLSLGSNFRHKGQALWVESVRDAVLSWLTERYDREERKETWQITMGAGVTILVF